MCRTRYARIIDTTSMCPLAPLIDDGAFLYRPLGWPLSIANQGETRLGTGASLSFSNPTGQFVILITGSAAI
jgi:hypothetical protein